jgi:N-methylhydantoinase A/oxoprolinase/acetone carboxylase beta subunit
MKRVLVPRMPGLLSALGMTLADEVEERSAALCSMDVAWRSAAFASSV